MISHPVRRSGALYDMRCILETLLQNPTVVEGFGIHRLHCHAAVAQIQPQVYSGSVACVDPSTSPHAQPHDYNSNA